MRCSSSTQRSAAISSDRARPLQRFKIGQPENYAQYTVSVRISWMQPRKRTWMHCVATPDSLQYYTVESQTGPILYDSRQDVTCDMVAFDATRQQFTSPPFIPPPLGD